MYAFMHYLFFYERCSKYREPYSGKQILMRRNVDIFQCSYGYGSLHFPGSFILEIPALGIFCIMVMLVIHKKKLESFGSYNTDFKKYKELMLVSISPNMENSRHTWEILGIET